VRGRKDEAGALEGNHFSRAMPVQVASTEEWFFFKLPAC
jgi:hypothetical protein